MSAKKIQFEILGILLQDKTFPDWWKSMPVPIPLFSDTKMPITFMDFEPDDDNDFIKEADSAIRNFFKLDDEYRKGISDLVYKNCTDVSDGIGKENIPNDITKIQNPEEVWKFVHPEEIFVTRRPYSDCDMYILVACECDWEVEHGLQFVFRQGKKITRISSQDGYLTEADAWGKPDEEDELLSKF